MSTHAIHATHAHAHAKAKRYTGIMDWLTTVDHKKIAVLYLLAGLLFFVIGGIEAILIRIQLFKPMNTFLDAQTFNEMLTMHGTTMIFFAAMPFVFAFMNAVIPLQIGARDVAYPFLNALGFWTFFFGALLMNISWFTGGAPDAGWTSYVPLASNSYSAGEGVDYYVIGLQISGIGSLLGGINFVATIINMRAPGMSFMRLPLFTWASFIASVLVVFAFPALTVGLVALMFDRLFLGNFFDVADGGNTVLWEHIFWIFGHPEVYILILPAFGILSEILPVFARKRLFGYSSMVFALVLIAFLGFMVWAHHMFTTGLGPVANALFSIGTMLIAVPTGIKVFNWLFTLWGGSIKFTAPALYAIAFVPTFVMGGVTGVMLASGAADYQYHDSYFVVAHFHYVIVGGIVLAVYGGLHFWWPKMFGRMLNETWGKVTFWLFFIGFHLTFFVQHFLGLLGMPRRVFTFLPNQGFETMNMVSTIGAIMMGVATLIFALNMLLSFRQPKGVANDPWGDGRSIEWALPSPPPEYNWKQIPLIRGSDAWWKEKMEGNTEMPAAEPLGPIHMPSPSILPFLMSVGFFFAGFGFIYHMNWLTIAGLLFVLLCMAVRSLKDDHGYHIHPEEVKE